MSTRNSIIAAETQFEALAKVVHQDRDRRARRSVRVRHFAMVTVLLIGGVVLAQDRTITVREVDVLPRTAMVDVLPDGGCMLTAYATVVSPSVEPQFTRTSYAFNGARCTTVKNAIITAAKKDLGCGDGSLP